MDAEDAHLVEPHRWHLSSWGYAARMEWVEDEGKQRHVSMARVILGLGHGDPRQADHISRDRLDNRRCNLRVATLAQQQQNRKATGKSKHRGVSYVKARSHRKPWRAQGKVDGVQHNIGHYATEQEAADAAREWRREHMPFAID